MGVAGPRPSRPTKPRRERPPAHKGSVSAAARFVAALGRWTRIGRQAAWRGSPAKTRTEWRKPVGYCSSANRPTRLFHWCVSTAEARHGASLSAGRLPGLVVQHHS